jgi:hypothetical protein
MSQWCIWDPTAGHNHLVNLSMIIDNLQMTLLMVAISIRSNGWRGWTNQIVEAVVNCCWQWQ